MIKNVKELNIPYIGIKVESIPTILNVLYNSKEDKDFIDYFLNTGKKTKTITEYLASLRNLKLAYKDNLNQTKINSAGINLLNDDIDILYNNLLNHCIKNFPDLKIIKNTIKKNNVKTLNDLIKELEVQNYIVRRQQTLSSYFKFFKDSSIVLSEVKKPHITNSENMEYLHLYKYILYFSKKINSNIIEVIDFKPFILSEYKNDEIKISTYMYNLSSSGKIRLYQIDKKLTNKDAYICVNNKYYSYFEVL